jgi:L-2-hydroxyglutarate oxidase
MPFDDEQRNSQLGPEMNVKRGSVGIVGGGLVGLATALRLAERWPDASIVLVEKEPHIGMHQSGHNSNVLHSGIYYRPGSHKARLCRAGKRAMEAFCDAESVPIKAVGKLIVATSEDEFSRLDDLYERGQANGVDCRRVTSSEARALEPRVHTLRALWVPETSIVDYTSVMAMMAERLQAMGHEIRTGTRVTAISEYDHGVRLTTSNATLGCDLAVNCAGLQSDVVARMAGVDPGLRIVGFRGEYHSLNGPLRDSISHLVYPVADPRFPFLGVHLTPTIDGDVLCGPNAVLALAREGYGWGVIDPLYLARTLTYSGVIRLAWRYWRMGLGEVWRSWSKRAFTTALQRMLPDVTPQDLSPDGSGVRAQAMGRDGRLVDDFAFRESARMVHLVNAPSPAATAAFAIADVVVDRLEVRM